MATNKDFVVKNGLQVGGNTVIDGTLTVQGEQIANTVTANTINRDPNITVNLTGDVTGSGNTTLTNLANGTINIATTVGGDTVALGTDTTGNYVATVTGTNNQIEVSGSGSETAAVTLSLPTDVTIDGVFTSANISVTHIESTNASIDDLSVTSNVDITGVLSTNKISVAANSEFDSGIYIGADEDILISESPTNALNLRVGTTGAYKNFSFEADGDLSAPGAITATGNLTANNLTLTSDDDLTFTQTSGDWSIRNAQQGNKVVIYDGTAGVQLVYGDTGTALTVLADGVTIDGNYILTTADEGTGNGIDADTVDGKHASDFTLDFVTDNNANTTNAIQVGALTATDATLTGDVQIDGDLTVSGNTVTVSATELAIDDNMIYLNSNSAVTNPDLGFAGSYNDGTYAHAGLFRDASDGRWKLFDSYTPEPDASIYIDTTHATYDHSDFQVGSLFADDKIGIGTTSALDTLDIRGNVTQIDSSPEYHFGTSSASHYNWRIAAQESVDGAFEIASGTQVSGTNATSDTYTPRLVVKADTGRVGIGTTAPDAPLTISTSGANAWAFRASANQSSFLMQDYNNGAYMFFDGSNGDFAGGDYMFVASPQANLLTLGNGVSNVLSVIPGKVGIGTTSPDTILEVRGSSPILTIRDSQTSSASAQATLRLAESGASDTLNNYYDITADGGVFKIIDAWNEGAGSGPDTRLTIIDNGNVGIGTTAPDSKLQVGPGTSNSPSSVLQVGKDGGNAELIALSLVNSRTGALGNGTAVAFHNASNYSPTGKISVVQAGTNVTDAEMRFFTYSGSLQQRMVIDHDGNLGIGNASPSGLLSLEKGTRNLDIKLETTPASGDVGVQFRAGTGDYLGFASGSTGTGIVVNNTNIVGIGTTTDSISNSKLQVAGGRVDITTSDTDNGAYRFYQGTTFRGGFGTTNWTGAANSGNNGVGLYTTGGDVTVHHNSGTPSFRFSDEGHFGLEKSDSAANITNGYPKIVYPNCQWAANGTTTGAVKIRTPGNLYNYDMVQIEITVYEYNSHAASKIIIGGHNWTSGATSTNAGWHNYNVQVIGSFNKPIYLAQDANDRYIVLGDNTSSWSYGMVSVARVHGASFYSTNIDWTSDWGIEQTTTASYTWSTDNQNSVSGTTLRTPGAFKFSTNSGSGFRIGRSNDNNMFITTATTGAAGVSLRDSAGNFKSQWYGDGTNYGFLDGDWASWDIKKVKNGRLYLNGSGTYYLQPESTSFVDTLLVDDSVGIGISAPETPLHIYQAAATPTLLTLHNYQSDINGVGNQGNFIDFKMTDDNATATPQVRIGMRVYDGDGTDAGIPSEGAGNFVVETMDPGTATDGTGTLTEHLRVTDKGRVGIGRSTPSYKLDVNGSSRITGQLVGGFGSATTSGTTDWNHSTNARSGMGYTLLLGNHTNGPGTTNYYHPLSFEYSSKDGTGNMTQFAIPYTGTNGPYFRSRYSGAWSGWAEIWNSGNDGAGSGLDADTVDGIQGDSLLRSDASDTYNGSGSTIAIRYTVPSGSRVASAGSSTRFPIEVYAPASTDAAITFHVHNDYAGYFGLDYELNDLVWGGWSVGSSTKHRIWHAGNDGSGSGLDADTLDGYQASNLQNSHDHTRILERSGITYGAGQLQWTDLSGTGGTGLNGSSPTNPTSDWYHHILMNHSNGNGYYVDLAACFHHDGLYMRRLTNGSLGSWNRFFADNYHPNADKWTTARTLSLSGDASGSVSWDGSANATLSVTVADNSHNHNNYTPIDHFRHTGHGYYTSTTTSALLTEALGDDAFDSKLTAHKTGWSYAGNGDLTDAGRLKELAGTSWLWWTDNSTDNVQGNITGLCIAPNTGGSAGKVFIYNNQGSGYSPGWREVWTSSSDGSGSGLDADLLDGYHESTFMRRSANSHLDMNNYNITEVNLLQFNDPGPNEGIEWVGGNGWKIYESPNNLTTNGAGNLQFVTGSTRRMTLGTTGALSGLASVYAGAFYYSSDRSLKENIITIDNALDKITSLRGVEYDWKESGKHSIGLIAQEVEEIIPEVVSEEDDQKSVNYGHLVGLLVEGVKEQQELIESQQKQIDELKEMVEKLLKG